MIKVAVDTGPLHGPMTGVGRAVEGLVYQLRRHVDEVELTEYVLSFRAKLHTQTRRLPFPAAITIKSWGQRDFPSAARHLPDVQILHGMNYVVPPTKLPRIVTVYDCWALLNPTQCTPVIHHSMNALRRSIQTGAVVHSSSQATSSTLHELFPQARIETIHLGAPPRRDVETSNRPPSLADFGNALFILAVGTIEKRKNYPRLIESFAIAAQEISELQLVIAGSAGDDSHELDLSLESLPKEVGQRIHLIGRVSDENIAWLYQHATAMAYPSLDEGFGFPLLEAMSEQLPIVGSTRGSIPEVAGSAAVLVDPLDVDALAKAITKVVTDSDLRQQLQHAAVDQYNKFSWDKSAQQLINLYTDLVK
ncbi:MAG: glycosyltransferase family 1 protein [Actinomycetes bacterium]